MDSKKINSIKPTWNLKGFIDDNETLWGSKEGEYHVFGGCEYLSALEDVYAVCAVGSSNVRKKIIEKLKDTSVKFATLVDPSVLYLNSVKIGEGAIVCAGTIITVNVNIGDHVIVNLDCTIGHDAVIDDFVTIYPSVNVSGNVLIGECSELGTGTQIIQGKKVISNTIIGAGAIVVKDCIESGTYVGSPAKKIK